MDLIPPRPPPKVDCRDRQAERALVDKLRRFAPPTGRLVPEVAKVSGVSLQEGRAMLEVPVEGALTARAWLAASTGEAVHPLPVVATDTGVPNLVQPAIVKVEPSTAAAAGSRDASSSVLETTAAATDYAANEHFQVEVWAVMVQALRGLAAVHSLSKGSTHGAVCLANILVAARSSPELPATAESVAGVVAGNSSPLAPAVASRTKRGFRRSQLGPAAPAALAYPSAGCIAPEVARGQKLSQPADVYAFGCALRAACCGAGHNESVYATGVDGGNWKGASGGGDGAGGKQTVLPAGLGPSFGPLREALVQLLESLLEEDASRRCTAVEVCVVCVVCVFSSLLFTAYWYINEYIHIHIHIHIYIYIINPSFFCSKL